MEQLRFAGHETFACRTTWLTKCVDFVTRRGWSAFTDPDSVVELGVGKNMTLSIRYWLQAFNIYSSIGAPMHGSRVFIGTDESPALDPWLESNDSLWLLHYELVTCQYATIYNFFFREFFRRKSSRHFTESEAVRSLNSWLIKEEKKLPASSTMKKDFRVLLDLYHMKVSEKSEESMTNLLTDLNIIVRTPFKSDGEPVYELNTAANNQISNELLAALLLHSFKDDNSVSFDTVYEQLGVILLFTREAFIQRIDNVCEEYSNMFVFKQDAGIREMQCLAPASPFSFLSNLRKAQELC